MSDADTLVKTHPRDKLLVMRQNKKSLEKVEKARERERKRDLRNWKKANAKDRKEKLEAANRAKSIELSEGILKKFAQHYLGEFILSNFSIRERLELIKLCASYCRLRLTVFVSPIIAGLEAILYDGRFVFLWLPLWILLTLCYIKIVLTKQQDYNHIDLFDYIEFLWHRRLLVENENNKLQEENNYKT